MYLSHSKASCKGVIFEIQTTNSAFSLCRHHWCNKPDDVCLYGSIMSRHEMSQNAQNAHNVYGIREPLVWSTLLTSECCVHDSNILFQWHWKNKSCCTFRSPMSTPNLGTATSTASLATYPEALMFPNVVTIVGRASSSTCFFSALFTETFWHSHTGSDSCTVAVFLLSKHFVRPAGSQTKRCAYSTITQGTLSYLTFKCGATSGATN